MKYSIFILIIILFNSCDKLKVEEFEKNCPYELVYDGHFFQIPISISPHQSSYKVGDTINISTVFSDSIYDLGTQNTFKIENFPFKPYSFLYRINSSETHDSGYQINELNIDKSYNPSFSYSDSYSDGFRAYTQYENNQYKFESELILEEPGVYILVFTDLYQSYEASGNEDLNAEADAVTFEGRCPTLPYYLCSMIASGDDHLKNFENEMIYLDEKVYRGKLRHHNNDPLDPLYPGNLSVEFNGFFGFEVVE